jgi:hypothetical protein
MNGRPPLSHRAKMALGGLSMLVSFGTVAGATPAAAQLGEVPIIEAGREDEIVALFAPYTLTGEVAAGYRLMNVRAPATHIVCELIGPSGEPATLRLDHPDHADEPDSRTASFAVTREADGASGQRALDALFAAVEVNDRGHFFRRRARPPPATLDRAVERIGPFGSAADGTFLCLVGLVFFVVLLVRELRQGSRWVSFALFFVTVAGAAFRLTLAPRTVLGAWPFSRTAILTQLIWDGPGLSAILRETGSEVGFFDLVTTVSLAFALVTPPAVFLHARKLLEDERAAVLSAAIIAFLPMHIRFSYSGVAFIPSIALSSFTFVLVHTSLKDASRAVRVAALVSLPLVAGLMFVTRPLNQLFLPLLLWTTLYLCRRTAPMSRRVVVSALVTLVGVLSFVWVVRPLYENQIADGATINTVISGVAALFSPTTNTLLHPWITPTGILLVACVGAWLTLRGERNVRERGVFLLGWLVVFFIAHAYVLPRSIFMQARYHLHIVVPFAMLAALGASHLYVRRRAIFWVFAIYLSVSPFVHASAIGRMLNDQNEYAFVRRAAETIPTPCTILEYTGEGTGDVDVRFDRVGATFDGRAERRRFAAIPIGARRGGPSPISDEALAVLETPPACLFYYEGLFCHGRKELEEPLAPACAAMHHAARLEEVAATRFPHRIYDENLAEGIADERREPIVLYLYRVLP